MQISHTRRKRRRKPTTTPRFGSSSVAFEIGLIRLSLDLQREQDEKKEVKSNNK